MQSPLRMMGEGEDGWEYDAREMMDTNFNKLLEMNYNMN